MGRRDIGELFRQVLQHDRGCHGHLSGADLIVIDDDNNNNDSAAADTDPFDLSVADEPTGHHRDTDLCRGPDSLRNYCRHDSDDDIVAVANKADASLDDVNVASWCGVHGVDHDHFDESCNHDNPADNHADGIDLQYVAACALDDVAPGKCRCLSGGRKP